MRRTIICIIVISATAGSGCAWFTPDAPDTGYNPSTTTPGVTVARRGSLDGYYRFTVDTVAVRTVPGLALDAEVAARIGDQLRRELVVRLADGYEVVTPPGAGVLRLTAEVQGLRSGPAYGLGAATVRAVISDSVTGAPLLVIHDERSHTDAFDLSLQSDWEAARAVMLLWADAIDAEIERIGR